MGFNSNIFSANKKLTPECIYNYNANYKDNYRSIYAIDRDRVLYSSAFRRLSDKTQVFFSDEITDVRTRLTHTLEVSQIARTIVTKLCCNLELTEAIALGHDVGHTPFGHVGERTLNLIMNGCEKIGKIEIPQGYRGFKHNIQSVRVLCDLENLCLSKYALWGIMHHSKIKYKQCTIGDICYNIHKSNNCGNNNTLSLDFYGNYVTNISQKYWSVEGLVVSIADEIAQRHHDIEDSLRYNIITPKDIFQKLKNGKYLFDNDDKRRFNVLENCLTKSESLDKFIAEYSRFIIKLYVRITIKHLKNTLRNIAGKYTISKMDDFYEKKVDIEESDYSALGNFPSELKGFDEDFHNFLKNSILCSYYAQSMDGKGAYIIRRLFEAYYSNPHQLPDYCLQFFNKQINGNNDKLTIGEIRNKLDNLRSDKNDLILIRIIADYIGSMTDTQAYKEFDKLYGTRF